MTKIICLIISITGTVSYSMSKDWTWLVRKIFNKDEIQILAQQKFFILEKVDLNHFKQLLFCWNALRPSEGYFSFFGQVRDAVNKRWLDLHHMIDWGKDQQCSYFDEGMVTKYHHVRLELPDNRLADGFRLKVVAQEGASLDLFRSLAVTLCNQNIFDVSCIADAQGLLSVTIPKVPRYSQKILDHPKAEVLCSPTSCSMLLSYLQQGTVVDAVHFAQQAYDAGLDAFGSWPFNIAHAFHASGGEMAHFLVTRLPSFRVLHHYLTKNIPIVVSVRGPLPGSAGEYAQGHLMVVIGWDAEGQRVMCHDPAFPTDEEVLVWYDFNDFCQAWGRSHCLAYVTELMLPRRSK
jgi:hypothetical protein